ncbi:hypothetical protein QT882_15110 [Xanthomonas fragariae]|nr:hypothetical protein [Xanthomonas fragariae]MDM7579724.1 hypothetical protein [Xanthomonas fragariae]
MFIILSSRALMRPSPRGQQRNSLLLKTPQFMKNLRLKLIVH